MSEHQFTDPIRHEVCTLVVRPGWVGVFHPRCEHAADVAVYLDSFYCTECKWNGRISGAWVADEMEKSA